MKMVSREVLEMAAQCPENLDLWKNLAREAKAAGMSQRAARSLLMEYGAPGITAKELVAER